MLKQVVTPEMAIEKFELSRHKDRPTIRDYIPLLFKDFVELHGDRGYADDKALLTGVALFAGTPVTVIGHVKGRNTKENIQANFGMPHPEGYRKALRQMKLAEKFRRPIITFVDTPGAYCGIGAEERGQGMAIAENLAEMFGFTVPIISIITGEGASGGALGIACANCVLMLENSIYTVISPKGFASILWKDASREKEAAARVRMTAQDLMEFGIIDGIINESDGGAHRNVDFTALEIKKAIEAGLKKFANMDAAGIKQHRYDKFRAMGDIGIE